MTNDTLYINLNILEAEPADEYHAKAGEYLSSHQLIDFMTCPWLYRKKQLGLIADSDSPALLIGRATHVRILERRDVYEAAFSFGGPVNPKTGKPFGSNTKAFAEWAAAQGNLPEHERDRIARARQLNPEGFYELPGVFTRGLPSAAARSTSGGKGGPFEGKVLKMAFTAIGRRESGLGTIGTVAGVIGRCLVLRRDPLAIIASQARLIGQEEVAGDNGAWSTPERVPSPVPYIVQAGWLCHWLADQDEDTRAKFRTVDTDDLLHEPAQGIDTIIEHFQLEPTTQQRRSAIDLINPGRQASLPSSFRGWPEQHAEMEDLARTLHAALGSLDPVELRAVAIEWQDFQREQMLEQARWVDDGEWNTWCRITPAGARLIANNVNGVHDHLRQSAQRKRRSRQGSLLPLDCQHYQRSSETYTIDRPADLGPLTRPLVDCQRDGVTRTLEQCFHCWQRGSLVDGQALQPQRRRQFARLTTEVSDGR